MQLLGLNTPELEQALVEMGQPKFRGRQVAEWIYQRGATSFDSMTNLSRDLRTSLTANHSLDFPQVAQRHVSR
ncbi:MAG: hypothetical protein JOZ57_13410, partial [Abitibacteriaceae bacterium]|nr:hypothetical protein [Abditibacteriaceae bacterium]